MKPYYDDGQLTIYHGDCREVLPLLQPVDAIVTDPPYGETSLVWDRWPDGWLAACRAVAKQMWCFGSLRMFVSQADEFDGWKLAQEVVWEKHNGTGLFNDRFRRVHELAAHFYRDDVPWSEIHKEPQFTNDARARVVRKKGRPAQWIGATGETTYVSEDGGPRLMRSVIQERSCHGSSLHPTQKPESIIAPLLRYSVPQGGGSARSIRRQRDDTRRSEKNRPTRHWHRSPRGLLRGDREPAGAVGVGRITPELSRAAKRRRLE